MTQYDRWMRIGAARRRLAAAARGRTLEVGIGTGLNLVHYPPDVMLTGIDLSPAMLAIARDRAVTLGIDADLRVRLVQAALDPVLNRYAGWHVTRDLPGNLAALGFSLEAQRRGRLGMVAELVARKRDHAPDDLPRGA